MLLDERHAKALFAAAGIPVPPSRTLAPGQADVPGFPPPWMLKSQVLSGGRGKAGGIRRIDDPAGLAAAAEALFALKIGGRTPPCLLVEPAASIAREFYLSFAVSRDRESLTMTVKPAGGMDVEAAGSVPALTQNIRLPQGPSPAQIRAAFFRLGLDKENFPAFAAIVENLFAAVMANGLLLAEVNPLALTRDGSLLALDGKAEIDDSTAEIVPGLARYHEPQHLSGRELVAREAGFSYVGLAGWVGCVVNGAGLAMATMDALNFAGLKAANFLDLGGAADQTRIRAALALLFEDARVGAVFINLYGGILSCAKVARALDAVLGDAPAVKAIVARLSGNAAAEGRAILAGRDGLHLVEDMGQALNLLRTLGPAGEPASLGEIGPRPAKLMPLPARHITFPKGLSALDFGPYTPVLVQGLTGKVATFHAELMRAYGTRVVAGVTPFKGGQSVLGAPVYDSVAEAARHHQIAASVIFVPGAFAAEAILEAADAGIPWIVCITEGIPQLDMLHILPGLRDSGARLIGPNTPGVIVPGAFKAGIMPVDPFTPGPVAVFSRSGTLTYESSARLSAAGIGQAVGVGVGGDPFIGLGFTDLLEMVRGDDRVKAVLLLGEIGGRAEEDAAAYVTATAYPKPVACFVAGLTAPPGRRMGHAGAILEEGGGVARKLSALRGAGISLCQSLDDVAPVLKKLLG